MAKVTLKLHASEAVVVSAAAEIYAAYVTAGENTLETEEDYVEKSVQAAIEIAQRVEQLVRSDKEMG